MTLPEFKLDAAGLVTVVVQDYRTGEVRMVGHANSEAIQRTLDSGLATFWSRSRQQFWTKGESSGHTLRVHEVWTDCDVDAVIYLVTPAGPTCHTGAPSCFFDRLDAPGDGRAVPALGRLELELKKRRASDAGKSYTKSLLEGGAEKIGRKIREEAGELADAIASESDERVASEMADVLYHAMVGLLSRDIPLADVQAELAARFGVSGHDEKRSRG